MPRKELTQREFAALGGKARTEKKAKSSRRNLKKAREAKKKSK